MQKGGMEFRNEEEQGNKKDLYCRDSTVFSVYDNADADYFNEVFYG